MKKTIVVMAMASMFLSAMPVSAQTVDVSQFRQVIELFIALGIIAPDKVDQVRSAFGIQAPIAVSTTTPIFGVSQSNVNNPNNSTSSPVLGSVQTFNPTVVVNAKNQIVVDMPSDGTFTVERHRRDGFPEDNVGHRKDTETYKVFKGINYRSVIGTDEYMRWTIRSGSDVKTGTYGE